jgi:hypothetical protein
VSEFNLLGFGCAVSFIAVAGAYLVLRERFTDVQSVDAPGVGEESEKDAVARPIPRPAAQR